MLALWDSSRLTLITIALFAEVFVFSGSIFWVSGLIVRPSGSPWPTKTHLLLNLLPFHRSFLGMVEDENLDLCEFGPRPIIHLEQVNLDAYDHSYTLDASDIYERHWESLALRWPKLALGKLHQATKKRCMRIRLCRIHNSKLPPADLDKSWALPNWTKLLLRVWRVANFRATRDFRRSMGLYDVKDFLPTKS